MDSFLVHCELNASYRHNALLNVALLEVLLRQELTQVQPTATVLLRFLKVGELNLTLQAGQSDRLVSADWVRA